MSIETDNMIFVFGSNLAGIHGAGAARFAMNNRGAKHGIGVGRTGQAYALPTKDGSARRRQILGTLSLSNIQLYVDMFIKYAKLHPELQFQVTAIGCGLAGLRHQDIAPMFKDAPFNCYFDTVWRPWLQFRSDRYWGTF